MMLPSERGDRPRRPRSDLRTEPQAAFGGVLDKTDRAKLGKESQHDAAVALEDPGQLVDSPNTERLARPRILGGISPAEADQHRQDECGKITDRGAWRSVGHRLESVRPRQVHAILEPDEASADASCLRDDVCPNECACGNRPLSAKARQK
jgi:hypothetical protein